MKKADQPFLQHIHAAIEQIEQYTKDVSYDLKNRFPEIPWISIIAMRNKLVHEYFGVDDQAVWLVVQDDLSKLKRVVLEILK